MVKKINIFIATLFIFFAFSDRALAIPSLIPIIPFIGIAIFKIVMALGALFFIVLSAIKKQKKVFIFTGATILILLMGIMVFY